MIFLEFNLGVRGQGTYGDNLHSKSTFWPFNVLSCISIATYLINNQVFVSIQPIKRHEYLWPELGTHVSGGDLIPAGP